MDVHREIHSAKCFLVLRDYKMSIKKCEEGLKMLQSLKDEVESDRSDCFDARKAQIAFGILAMQGLMLDGRCREMGAFAEKWFGRSRTFPPEILQICICHHLQVQELQSALHLVEDWLDDEQNHRSSSFDQVVELFVRHILLPLKEIEKVEAMLRKYKNISSENKKNLSICVEKVKNETSRPVAGYPEKTDDQTSLCSPTNTVNGKEMSLKGPLLALILRISKLFKTVKQIMTNSASIKIGIKIGARIMAVFFFLYIIIFKTYLPGDIFNSRISGSSFLWNAVKQAWNALFAPYHLIQNA